MGEAGSSARNAHTMKVIVLIWAVVSLSAAAFGDVESIRETLFASTNYWGRDVEAYKAQVATNSRALARLGTPESFRVRRDYYETLMDFQIPTNDVRAYRQWIEIWARKLSAFGVGTLSADSTNLWMRHAALCAELRTAARSHKAIVEEARQRFPAREGDVGNLGPMKKWIWQECDRDTARQTAASLLVEGLVEIGSKGVPMLPAEERWQFYTNFVERAGLEEDRRGEIRAAISR